MSRKSLESVVGKQNAGQILEEVQGSIGKVSELELIYENSSLAKFEK